MLPPSFQLLFSLLMLINNTFSIPSKMHEKFGFRVVGRRERIGKMLCGPYNGVWRDIVLMERRSTVVGMD